ncbi:hypothetical protein D3C71_360740 [compost metagenome]
MSEKAGNFRHQIQKHIEDNAEPAAAARAIDLMLRDTTWRQGYGYFNSTETRRIIEDSASAHEAAMRICIALELKLRLKKDGWFEGDAELEEPMNAAIEADRLAFAAEGALLSAEDRALMLRLNELARYWKLTPHTDLPPHPFGMDLALSSIRCTSPEFLRNMMRMSVIDRIRVSEDWSWLAAALERALELGNALEAHNNLKKDDLGLLLLQKQLGITFSFWDGDHMKWRHPGNFVL